MGSPLRYALTLGCLAANGVMFALWSRTAAHPAHHDLIAWKGHFVLWYPAALLAFSGIATLRLGKRFTLRSLLLATVSFALMLAGLVAVAKPQTRGHAQGAYSQQPAHR
jgi:hypothetical protein